MSSSADAASDVRLVCPGAAEERGAVRAAAVVAGGERERGPVDLPAVGREALRFAEAAPVTLGCEPEHGSGERDQAAADGVECFGAARASGPSEEDDAVVGEAHVPQAGGQCRTGRAPDVGCG